MEQKIEEAMQNYFRWITGLLLVALSIFANSYYSSEPLLYRVLGVVFLVAISLAILFSTKKGKKL